MSTLSEYVMRRLDAGRSGPEICAELMAVGWSKDAADAAYREGLIALGIPLPDAAHASALSRYLCRNVRRMIRVKGG